MEKDNSGKVLYKGRLYDVEGMSIEERAKFIKMVKADIAELNAKMDKTIAEMDADDPLNNIDNDIDEDGDR